VVKTQLRRLGARDKRTSLVNSVLDSKVLDSQVLDSKVLDSKELLHGGM
jgi:hypothetical protein